MPMNLKDIMDALKNASAEERAAFSKALEPGQTGGQGLTREQLDAALEPFKKGAGGPADFGGAQQAAQLDVTGWIQQITDSVVQSANRMTAALDNFAKGFVTFGEANIAMKGELEEMRKSLTAPGAASAVTRQSQQFAKGNAMPGAGAGGIAQPPAEGGRFAELSEAQVVAHLQTVMQAEQDPMRKSKIGDALAMVELDYAITDDFFAKLGIAEPTVG